MEKAFDVKTKTGLSFISVKQLYDLYNRCSYNHRSLLINNSMVGNTKYRPWVNKIISFSVL